MGQAHTKLITGGQMARIDQRAIQGGISGDCLMEAAGRGVARVLKDLLGGFQNRRITLLCGKGNNGGDGLVVARLASLDGATVRVFLFASADDVAGDARLNLNRAHGCGLHIEEIRTPEDLPTVRQALADTHAVVDALLGTGIRGGAKGLVADAIALLEEARCPILAVDVPSGLDADTGHAEGPCAAAACTVTFGQPRLGQFLYPGRSLCGRLHLIDIGLPASAVEAESVQTYLAAACGGAPLLPHRQPTAHKGACGRVAIVAGSIGLTGAASLSAGAALRAGAGLVTVGVPESLNSILEVKLTEAMTRPLPEVRKARCIALRARGEIRTLIAQADCFALGPGLGTHRETVELVKRIIQDVRIPTVLDADALNALAGEANRLTALCAPAVITPHPGEFSRLTGTDTSEVLSDPLNAAQSLATAVGVTVVLKGAPTVVATPDGDCFVNPSGNAGMATGGAGDVLTGILAALIGQGLGVVQAACLGVYLHGLAGDLAAETRGQAGLVAGDIVSALPAAEQQIRNREDRHRYIQRYSDSFIEGNRHAQHSRKHQRDD